METFYTLEQFVERVNDCLEQKAPELCAKGFVLEDPWRPVTDRQVRDYRTKGVTTEAIRHGREVRYTEAHVEEMVELKVAQKTGITSRAYESLKKHLGAGDAGLVDGAAADPSLFASAGGSAPVPDDDARLRAAGLTYLSSLGRAPTAEPVVRLARTASGAMIGGAAGAFSAAVGSGDVLESSSALRALPARSEGSAKASAATWSEWEPFPGVRLQVRSDALASWGEAQTKMLTDLIKTFSNP